MQILKTNDYTLFKLIVANREIDEKHVNRLAKSITRKNLLYIRPLIVNEKMQIIDGQHRLAAAKICKATVHYIKVDGLTKSDISVINTAQKNWTRSDFINFYAMDGNTHYKQLAAFLDKYYWLSPTVIIEIACDGRLGDLKEGKIKVKDTKLADAAFQRLRQIEGPFPWIAKTAHAATTLASALDTDSKLKTFMSRATEKTFYPCKDRADYRKLIEAILKP